MLFGPMDPLTIRPYRGSDREAVRRICCETADKGEPVEQFFRDREVFADLVTRYYTDQEPGSAWVAESGGRVAGYLTGCLDTRRYWRAVRLRIVPAALARALARGTFLHRETGRLFVKGVRAFLRGDLRRPVDLARYPAHLHINILRELRGRHAGRLLMERFIGQCRAAGVRGVHLVTRADNADAHRFFERMGFTKISGGEEAGEEGSRIYGKDLAQGQ